ncbi:MAG: serine protease [Planctomycetales bacterium]|nr:serine protease [Planctomycetales bacterium]
MKKVVAMAFLLSCLSPVVLADEASVIKAAKGVMSKYADALVWVSAVSKTEVSGLGVILGSGNEQKVEVVGTVIDPSGLTVVSYTALDPMSAIGNISVQIGDNTQKIDPKSEFSDVKITLADGTEMDAKLVMKDIDLDLAFIMPEKSGDAKLPAFSCIPLDKGGKAEILDSIITLTRLGKLLDRQCSVALSRISAVVKKPRTFYCGGTDYEGTPVFTENGEILGISTIRKANSGDSAGMSLRGLQAVIVPAGDVMKIAKQAMETAAEDTEKEDENAVDKTADTTD